MKKLLAIFGIIALIGIVMLMAVQAGAATLEFGWQQTDLAAGNQNFYGWKVWQSNVQNGTYTQFGTDVVWDGAVKSEYTWTTSITPPAGQETTYFFKLDAWNKPGTSTPLNSGFSNIVQVSYDLKPPTVPVVTSQVPATTTTATLQLSGTKEANSSIAVNGTEKVAVNAATTWSATLDLAMGANAFAITSKDADGNVSGAVSISTTRIEPPTTPVLPTGFRVIKR